MIELLVSIAFSPPGAKAKVLFKTTIPPQAKIAVCRFRSADDASWENNYKRNYLVFSYLQ